jgi:hypothetical protein
MDRHTRGWAVDLARLMAQVGEVYCGGSYKGNERPNSLVVEPSKCEIRTFAGN